MAISVKRAYEEPSVDDGYRVLVDRIWPRGISKEKAQLDEWLKEVAPSNQLRKSYHSGAISWDEFRKQYLSDLKRHRDDLRPLAERAKNEKVTLVFSSKNLQHNNAVVLKQYVEMLD